MHPENVGFSRRFKRATEPQHLPEGMIMLALNLFKASAAPEGSKEEKI
ncbi:hypothetical protein [Candidatus Methanoperedens nitratireducens]|nr:hypothetical protein [Candidatus Methanoperedens nitroreducens]